MDISGLERVLEYSFKNKTLVREAIMHPSSSPSKFELLEFIGDRVVSLIVARELWELRPENEKIYAQNFVFATNKEALLSVGKKMNLGHFIVWKGCQTHEDTIISDGCEAILGAIYVDSGLEDARDVFRRFWTVKELKSEEIDSKTYLQNLAKMRKVEYKIVFQKGLPHDMEYTIEVKVGNLSSIGHGPSIKAAEKNAAKNFLDKHMGYLKKRER